MVFKIKTTQCLKTEYNKLNLKNNPKKKFESTQANPSNMRFK